MYQKTGKPSIAKFKSRLITIIKACHTGRVLAEKWNPKGRNFKIQRDMLKFFAETETEAYSYLTTLELRAGSKTRERTLRTLRSFQSQ
jgi:hypothetical protein